MAKDSASFLKKTIFPLILQNSIYFTQHFDSEIETHGPDSFIFYGCMLLVLLLFRPCDPMDRSPPGSPAHGFLQARILEWFAISVSLGSS